MNQLTSTPEELSLGAALISDRLRMGVSQARFADMLSVSQQSLSKWESGVSIPRDHRLAAIQAVLGAESAAGQVIAQILAAKIAVLRPQRVSYETSLITGHPTPESAEWWRAQNRKQAHMLETNQARMGMRPLPDREAALLKAAADISAASETLARAAEIIAAAIREAQNN